MSTELPLHARLVATPEVWMEGEGLAQLARVASLPGCLRAVGMPDLHAGPGLPIGVALAMDRVWPELIGGDAGCGARLVPVPRAKLRGDALERRVRDALLDDPLEGCAPDEVLAAVWRGGARGLAEVAGVPDDLAALCAREPEERGQVGPVPDDSSFARALGTIGGGNHFAEVSRVEAVVDRARAAAAGLVHDGTVVLVHTGSRGLGKALAARWGQGASDDVERFLGDLEGACRFARANRVVVAHRLLRALSASRPERCGHAVDLVHNTVVPYDLGGATTWLHRKGCAPAAADALTVVLGSRGAPSWVLEGAGNPDVLASVAHGAGRRMTRSEALAKLRAKHTRASLTRTATGGRVLCDDTGTLYEEHADAYKPIEPVIESLERAGAARRVASLVPLVTVK